MAEAAALELDGQGRVPLRKLVGNESYQPLRRLRAELADYVLDPDSGIVENAGGGEYRLNLDQECVSFDFESLRGHWNQEVVAMVGKVGELAWGPSSGKSLDAA